MLGTEPNGVVTRMLVATVLLLAAGVPCPAAEHPETPAVSPAMVIGRELSVEEAVVIALENQPEIKARLQDYAAATARVSEAMSPLLPQLTAFSAAAKSQNVIVQTTPQTGVTSVFTSTRDFQQTFTAQLQLSQLLFDFGQNWAAVKAARKTAAATFETIEAERLLIADATKEAYTNINLGKRLVEVAQQSLNRAELNLKSAQGFYDLGTQPRQAVTLAEVDVANAQVSMIQAVNAVDVARVALNTAMGLPVSTPTLVRDNLAFVPVPLDPELLQAAALAQRPEYRQAKLTAEAADWTLSQIARSFFPTIAGNSAFGGNTTALNQAWAATLSFTWPIYDGGNTIAKYKEAKANLEAANLRVKASELVIAQQVEQARLNVREAAQRAEAGRKLIASAEENFRLAQGRYDVHVGTILELSNAQLQLTQAQQTEAQALADYQIGLARLDLAIGRR
jgi:outer membrane protein TolC